jgi:signal-transduction protein with cAMP-binding, CBS, and nucleotidyltransferase domain
MGGDDKTTMVELIMTRLPLQTANESKSVSEVSKQMNESGKGSVIVVDQNNRPVGIVTERDVVRKVVALDKDPKKITASEIMSKPLISVGPEAYVYDAALIMTKYRIRRLPIVRDNTLLGIVTSTDLARRVYEKNKKDPTLAAMSRFALIEQA